ncbi:MAG TPA: hypothetical protein VHD15_17550 [Hyphomicrobiales bacterium]|nr:hypothetical protein [Hyphomicrobiales bacterium]
MTKRILAAIVAVAGLAVPAAASAANAVLTTQTAVRAGPGGEYPAIVRAGPGTGVSVHGCLSRWSWCDVSIVGQRGWVPGSHVQYFYNGRYVLLPSYAPVYGIPVVTFGFADYWNRWYVGRPWYYDGGYWGRWGVGFRAPIPPAGWHPWHPGWDRGGFYPGRAAVRADVRRDVRHDVRHDVRRDARRDVRRDARRDVRRDVRRDARRDVRRDVHRDVRRDARAGRGGGHGGHGGGGDRRHH